MRESIPKLESLDVKGRDIEGLEPAPEQFSVLEPGLDWKVESICPELKTNIDLERSMIFVNPSGGDVSLDITAPHWRSITRKGVTASLETEHGAEYFYEANVKGCGYLKPTVKGEHTFEEYDDWNRVNEYEAAGAYGLADKEEFSNKNGNIIDHTKYLMGHGLRTELYGAWGKLNNVYYKGRKMPVQKLRDQGIIPRSRDLVPTVGLRFLKTNTRVAEFTEHSDEFSMKFLKNAFDTFNKETADKKLDLPQISLEDRATHNIFFKTFIERMAQNLAVLNNLGYSDWHLHASNVTMAAEIADIGTIMDNKKVRKEQDSKVIAHGVRIGYIKDMRDVGFTIATMLRRAEALGVVVGDRQALFESSLKGFNEMLNNESIRFAQKGNAENHRKLFKYVMIRSILEDKPLSSVKKIDPSEWKISSI